MTKLKLTPTQLTVLRDTAADHVYRSERGHDLYACYDRAQGRKRVTAIVERLSRLDLVRISDQRGMERPWHVTAQGEQACAAAR